MKCAATSLKKRSLKTRDVPVSHGNKEAKKENHVLVCLPLLVSLVPPAATAAAAATAGASAGGGWDIGDRDADADSFSWPHVRT